MLLIERGAHQLFLFQAEISPSADLKYFALMESAPNPGMNPQNETFHLKIVNNNERLSSLIPYEVEEFFWNLADSRITYDIGLRKEESVIQAFKWNGKRNDFVSYLWS